VQTLLLLLLLLLVLLLHHICWLVTAGSLAIPAYFCFIRSSRDSVELSFSGFGCFAPNL
jgi:hypothetical protein